MATKASQWKKKGKREDELTLPSGNVVTVRRIKPEAFLEGGFIPDPIFKMVQKAISSKKGLPPKAAEEIAQDPDKIASALEVFDRALVFCLVEPQAEMAPGCRQCEELYTARIHIDRRVDGFHRYLEGDRDPEVLYTDDVELEDKQFLFQWAVGGTQDIARFREQLDGHVEPSLGGEGVPQTA